MSEITQRLSAALEDRYRVGEQVGQGGMATVFLAEDIRHQRRVAIKVLRPELAAMIGADRFLKEIQVTANLQHPHILPLHDSGEADSFLYYVMPYIEGESLRDLLDREKQLGIDEAVDIIRAIAGAVDYAHRQDVIHRDIKPENILMHDGQPLVADFGIALAVNSASDTRLTETGLSIGTPHYMSPEQAMGDRALDARSDVYSLGAMLYEMLAGDPPYQGSTAQAIVAKVITEKAPPVTVARDTVPAHVAAAIKTSLNKLPADRFSSAAAFADALGNTSFQGAAAGLTQAAAAPSEGAGRKNMLKPALLGALLLALGVAVGWFARPAEPQSVERYTLPEWANADNGIDISPDGSAIAGGLTVGSGSELAVRNRSAIDVAFFGGPEIRFSPVFSPDGSELAYLTPGMIRRMNIAGTPPVTILESGFNAGGGLEWGGDGYIYFTTDPTGDLGRIPVSGGEPEVVARQSTGAGAVNFIAYPDLLPNEKHMVVTLTGNSDADANIGIVDLESGEVRPLMAGMMGRYSETGHLLYVSSDGNLFAVPFDPDEVEVTGAPIGIAGSIYRPGFGYAGYAVSRSGDLLYQTNDSALAGRSLVIVDREGRTTPLPFEYDQYNDVSVSPDGSRIAFEIILPGADGGDIYVADFDDSVSTRLTFEGVNSYPVWTADGTMVGFSRFTGSDRDLFWKPADGSRSAEPVFAREGTQFEIAFSPDGDWVAYREGNASVTDELNVGYTPLAGGEFRNFSAEENVRERSPTFSPDGNWLAYASDISGRAEVYVRAFPGEGSGAVRQISSDGGAGPIWSKDGTALFYTSATAIVEAQLEFGSTVNVRSRTVLFETAGFASNPWNPRYDVLPDGNFIMISLGGARGSLTTVLVRNWAEEMR